LVEPIITITNIAKINGIILTEEQQSLLSRYRELLLEWNRKINLISRRDEGNAWHSHILHALSVLFLVRPPPHGRVLDLGTGGGLPGIPLAIVRQDLDMVLIDSIHKKVRAVEDMVERLGIRNVRVICSRAEDLDASRGFARSFDIVVARAVASIEELVRWAKPLLKPDHNTAGRLATLAATGLPHEISSPYLLCMKGGDVEGELQKAKTKVGVTEVLVLDLVYNGSLASSPGEKKIIVIRP
jgi:16S rRNA (guanine527-N7)-methyltransferase